MRRFQAHFARLSGRRRLAAGFLAVFGGLWLTLEPAGLFFLDAFEWGWSGYLGLVAVSIASAVYLARPRDAVTRSLPPTDVTVAIRVGDVLAENGNVVVGANDTFDTQFEDEVISRSSVEGQLLERMFEGDRSELDRQIDESAGPPARPSTLARPSANDTDTRLAPSPSPATAERATSYLPSRRCPRRCPHTFAPRSRISRSPSHAPGKRSTPPGSESRSTHRSLAPISPDSESPRTLLIQMIVLSFITATRGGAPSTLTVWISPRDRDVVDIIVLDD